MWSERIYEALPVALQNVAVSLRGAQLQVVRYGSASFHDTARRLERNEQLTLLELEEFQFAALRELAEHCYQHSPFYRRLWRSRGLEPGDIRTSCDIWRIPLVTKQDLRAHTEEFFTEQRARGVTVVHTSGTTGSPLTVQFSNQDIGRRYAFLERCRRWAGVRIGQRRATFTGRNLVGRGQSGAPFWRYNRPGKQLLFSSYHLLSANLPAYVAALERFQPEIIDGYPSAISIVADHILRRGEARKIRPQAVLVSAETVFPHQRETIEAAFQAKLYNQYASSEGAPFISECRHGRLHVHLDSGLIEIVDGEGRPAAPGQVGEMVVSSFTSRLVPLLRYAIGDTATASQETEACPCGLPFPTITALGGRVDDVLCTPERGWVGRLDTVFKAVPNSIVEAQIVQTSPETIVLRLVPDRSRYRPEHAHQIVRQMRSRLGEIVRIEVEEVCAIPRSANGKMRSVINLCGQTLSGPPSAQRAEKLISREHPQRENSKGWPSQIGIVRIIGRLNVGGPAIQAILMTAAFRARGFGAVLVAGKVANGERDMAYLAAARGVEIVSIPALSRGISGSKDLASLWQLIRTLRRHRPAIVHTHTAKAGTLGRLGAMIVRTPVRVHTFHGHIFKGYFSPLVTRAFLSMERFLARHTDCIIAISESQRKELIDTYRIAPSHKVVTVPLGLDLSPYLEVQEGNGKLRAALQCPASTPVVGWVGRFTAIKAPGLFLDCVPLVRETFSGARFVMVGGGELWEECRERIARDGHQNTVALLGWRRSLAEIYADLDLVVCTSISEGTPVALLEAMASGKAIVSADVGGVRDLMTGPPSLCESMEFFQNGVLVGRDPGLVAGAIRHLLADPDRVRAMGRAGREFVRERFSQHRLADELETIYLSLARAKGLLPLADAFPIARPVSAPLSSTRETFGQLAPPNGTAEVERDSLFKQSNA